MIIRAGTVVQCMTKLENTGCLNTFQLLTLYFHIMQYMIIKAGTKSTVHDQFYEDTILFIILMNLHSFLRFEILSLWNNVFIFKVFTLLQ